MNIRNNFELLKTHAWYSRKFKKLKQSDLDVCYEIIKSFENMVNEDLVFKAMRLFVDDSSKPNNWGIIQELILVSCSKK